MWRLFVLSLLANLAVSRPTTTTSSCTKTELLSSLSSDGVEFCESLLDSHCATASTPAPYTTYGGNEISSYCECVLADISSTATDATSGGGFGQPTETNDDYSAPGTSETSTSQASTGVGSGSRSASSTATSGGSQTTATVSTDSTTSTDFLSSLNGTATATSRQASGASSGLSASTKGTVTGPTTRSETTTPTGSAEPTDSAEGTVIPLPTNSKSNATATADSTSSPGSGSWNSTASTPAPASTAGTAGTFSSDTTLPTSSGTAGSSSSTASVVSGSTTAGPISTASSGMTLPTQSGTAGSWNSTGPPSPSSVETGSSSVPGEQQTTPSASGQPPGTSSQPGDGAGSWNRTTAPGQTLNGTSIPTDAVIPSSPTLLSGSSGLPPLPTEGSGSWNSTAIPGQNNSGTALPPGPTGSEATNGTATTSFPVSLITPSPGPGPVPTSIRTSTGAGLSAPWNSSLTSSGPSGSAGSGAGTISSTGALPTTLANSNTSGSAFTLPTASVSVSLSTNATSRTTTLPGSNETSPGPGLPVTPGQSSTLSPFPGWNATLSTSAGRITPTAGTGIPTGSGAGGVNQTTGASTSRSAPGTALGNSTTGSDSSIPTSSGQQNTATATGTSPPGIPLPIPSSQSNTTVTSGAANSTAGSVTVLPTKGLPSASNNVTFTLSASSTPTANATDATSGPTGSAAITSAPGIANSTTAAGATPTSLTATGSGNSSSSTVSPSDGAAPIPSGTEIPAANFTEVFRNAAVAQETCYTLPRDAEGGATRRAVVRNSKLREANVSIPSPYIESIDFDSAGLQPLFMTIRNSEQGTPYFLDVSNKSRLAIVDESGASMVLDDQGLRFATNSCRYDVNVTISDMFAQLADLSDTECSFGNSSIPPPPPVKRAEDIQWNQTLFLENQCGDPVTRSIRDYPELRIGDTECVDVTIDEDSGRWDFDCTYPGSDSGTIRCQNTVKNDIIDFLIKDSFGGECPDVSTMVSTLVNSSSDVLNSESLLEELQNRVETGGESSDIDSVVDAYAGLSSALQEFFVPAEGNTSSPFETFFSVYDENRNFVNDVCESLHAGEIPLSLNLRAGATYIDAITTLNWAPETAEPYNITVQDPSSRACCTSSFVAQDQGEESCEYPSDAFVGETGCICGETTSGKAIAYEATECSNFGETCDSNEDCSAENFVCLVGTCCGEEGEGICVDPYACSQNGTALVTFDLDDALADAWK